MAAAVWPGVTFVDGKGGGNCMLKGGNAPKGGGVKVGGVNGCWLFDDAALVDEVFVDCTDSSVLGEISVVVVVVGVSCVDFNAAFFSFSSYKRSKRL